MNIDAATHGNAAARRPATAFMPRTPPTRDA